MFYSKEMDLLFLENKYDDTEFRNNLRELDFIQLDKFYNLLLYKYHKYEEDPTSKYDMYYPIVKENFFNQIYMVGKRMNLPNPKIIQDVTNAARFNPEYDPRYTRRTKKSTKVNPKRCACMRKK